MSTRLPWPIFSVFLLALCAGCAPPPVPLAGVDHIAVAVRDLDVAAARYQALGFTLKPGRLHDNSIRNVHAKNADGTELELITASAPRDSLAVRYRHLIEAGEGPAFLALHGDLDALQAAIEKAGLAYSRRGRTIALLDPRIDYLFFVADNHSPTDRPEHFVHANTSSALTRVWLADDGNPALRKLLTALGARFSFRDELIPQKVRVEIAQLDGSEIILLPASMRFIADRPVIGATLRTADPMATLKLLSAAGLVGWSWNQDARGTGLILEPRVTHGFKLEFLKGD